MNLQEQVDVILKDVILDCDQDQQNNCMKCIQNIGDDEVICMKKINKPTY